MLKDVTLGMYFPGKTAAHRLDPRTKILLTFLYLITIFLVDSYSGYAVCAIVLVASAKISKVKPMMLIRGLKPLVLLIVMTAFINAFFTQGEDVIFKLGVLTLTIEGIHRAIFMLLRVVLLISGTFIMTYTTSPLAITDGLELLMNPLKKIKFPVHDIAMMMSIALRFIPTLISETDKIMSAQRARGASFDTGNLAEKAKSLLPILVPLFVSSFKRADELAIAMECRCYNGGVGRTRMRVLKLQSGDFMALILGLVMLGAVVFINTLDFLV